jgi:galactokinase
VTATDTRTADAAIALFAERFATDPTGTWSAPGRVNLIGEHTDYNDGFVLPFAIQHRTHVALGLRDDHRIRVVSTFDGSAVEAGLAELHTLFPERRDEVPEWARYPLGVAWALLAASGIDPSRVPGVDLAFASDVPVGAGLSSSAAIEGATAVALAETWAIDLDRVALAKVGRRAENEAVGARMTGGGFGGAAIALVARDRVQAVTDAATAAFASAGFAAPTIFTVTPSAGAARD